MIFHRPLNVREKIILTTAAFPNRVHYVNHEKTAAALINGGRVIEDEALIVIANRGRQRGPEMRDKTNHVFIIVDGEADFITGGTMIDPKVISPKRGMHQLFARIERLSTLKPLRGRRIVMGILS